MIFERLRTFLKTRRKTYELIADPEKIKERDAHIYRVAYSDGYLQAEPAVLRRVYAAVCLALKEKHGFGKQRCMDILKIADEKIVNEIRCEEDAFEVLNSMGIKVNFGEEGDRIQDWDVKKNDDVMLR